MDKQPVPTVKLNPQPLKVGDEWYIVAAYPSGQEERIIGFKTEVAAKDWIANDSKAWRRRRGYADE
jgi:hypothetical protein